MFENIIGDLNLYNESFREVGTIKTIFYLVFSQELNAVLIYRFGHWVEFKCKIPILRQLLSFVYFFKKSNLESYRC